MIKKIISFSILAILLLISWLGIKILAPRQNSGSVSKTEKMDIDLSVYDLADLYKETKSKCSDTSCFEKELQSAIPIYGPSASLELLQELQNDRSIDLSIDDHQIAHRIGRETAKIFGSNGESFLLCPTSYNYGCQHGFFEYVLGRTGSTKETAAIICGSIEEDMNFSSKFKFYCYHGLGHGILMANAYDLYSSLSTCDSLPTHIGQEGCWQGVFMENVNGGMRGEARKDIFSETDPLAPCNVVAEKYRQECFINHSGWLMKFFKNNVDQASRACLKAPINNIDACMQSIGLMSTNPSWQYGLLSNSKGKTSEEIAKQICALFPPSHKNQCLAGAVDNIMNFNELNISKAANFCDIIDPELRIWCYEKIGSNLRAQTIDQKVIIKECSAVENILKAACLRGAGI